MASLYLAISFLCIFTAIHGAMAKTCEIVPASSDFEEGAGSWESGLKQSAGVLRDPRGRQNHVLRIPAVSDVTVPEDVDSLSVRCRMLVTPQVRFRFGSKLVLRIRLYDLEGNSKFWVREIQRSRNWQQFAVELRCIAQFRNRITLEVQNSDDPVYVDDVCLTRGESCPMDASGDTPE